MNWETTACFTGHRPEKICSPYREKSKFVDDLKHELQNRILKAVDDGYKTFLCGMAQGVDIWAGEIVESLWEPFRDVELVAVLPFPAQCRGWEREWAVRHRRLLKYCSEVVTVSPFYSKDCFFARNRYLAEHASRLIGVSKPFARGGTGYTIAYAKSLGLQLDIVPIP